MRPSPTGLLACRCHVYMLSRSLTHTPLARPLLPRYAALDIKLAGYSCYDMRTAGFAAVEQKAAGASPSEMRIAGYTSLEMREAGFSAKKVKAAGYTASEACRANWAVEVLKEAGYSCGEVRRRQRGVRKSGGGAAGKKRPHHLAR